MSSNVKRVAIYARYSSDKQNESSVDDQVSLCERFARTKNDWVVTARYFDKAVSGSGLKNRPGVTAMLKAARAGEFDVILAEHPDRIGRNTSDLTRVHDQCAFDGQEIWTVHLGLLDQMSAALHGMMGQHQREETARKVHRGMRPRATAGKFMGGQPYGYRLMVDRTHDTRHEGILEIIEEQAEVIRRIYRLYVDGRNARYIAHALNEDNVPAPRGGLWNASTINGEKSRGNGILRNPLYDGKPSWNKVSMKKVPGDATKRVSRPNPISDHVTADMPELRIVDEKLFLAAQARNNARAQVRPISQRTKKRMLSGLLRCAGCGGGMSIKDRDKSGKVRIQCSTHAESGSCGDPHTVYLDIVERKVVAKVLHLFGSKEDLEVAVRTARAEIQNATSSEASERERLVRRVADLERKSKKLVDMCVDMDEGQEIFAEKLQAIHGERRDLQAKIADLGADVAKIVSVDPIALKAVVSSATMLQALMQRGDAEGDHDVSEAFRKFIHSVVVHGGQGWRVEPEVEVSTPWAALCAASETSGDLDGGIARNGPPLPFACPA